MKKRIGFFSLVSIVVTLIATVVTSSASFWFLYQPKAPKCLK